LPRIFARGCRGGTGRHESAFALNSKLAEQIGGILDRAKSSPLATLRNAGRRETFGTLTSKGRAFSATTRSSVSRMASRTWAAFCPSRTFSGWTNMSIDGSRSWPSSDGGAIVQTEQPQREQFDFPSSMRIVSLVKLEIHSRLGAALLLYDPHDADFVSGRRLDAEDDPR
jgi:hypothetical protein